MIHLLHDDTLTHENREKFLRTTQKYSQEIEFVNVEAYKNNFSDKILGALRIWTVGCLYRLLIPEVLGNVDKIIYLDCDVLVNLDIKNLWDIDMEGNSLAGVKDLPIIGTYGKIVTKLTGRKNESYINSGVVIMDLRKIRERGIFLQIVTNWIVENKKLIIFPDQDALNNVFVQDIKILPENFNTVVGYNFDPRESTLPQNCIFHLCASKPWTGLKGILTDRVYWKMYVRSAWGENLTYDEVIDRLNDMAFLTVQSECYHSSQRQCFGRILRILRLRLFFPFRSIRYLVNVICNKLKH